MRGSHAQSRLLWSAMVLVVFACAALPAAAGADPGKPYTLNIAPASVPAGTHATFSATFSNPAGAQQQLGSANVTVPAGLVVRSASVPGPATATVSGNAVQVRGMSLTAGNSLTVSVVADVPCSPGVLAWTVQAKQANDFKGPPGNDMTLAQPSSLTTTVSGQCRLQFATQPANARVGEAISGTPYAPGPPVSVEIVDGSGARVTGSSANVTVAPGAGSAAGTLTGTTTAATVLGAASFS